MPSKGDPCQKQACAIQTCLQENNYQESRCQRVLDALKQCCEQVPVGESVVCSGIHRSMAKTKTS